MKNTMKLLGIIAFVALIGFAMASCGALGNLTGGSEVRRVPSGTFYLDLTGFNWSIYFDDYGRFTLYMNGERLTGQCSLESGNTISLNGEGIHQYWAQVDSNTLRDSDGDYWRK